MNLTDGATFPESLIERVKYIFNVKKRFSRDTKQRIRKIAINNGWKS